MNEKIKFKAEMIVAVSSMLVAVTAIVLTMVQINQTEKFNRLSVLPNLNIHTLVNKNVCSNPEIYFELISNGLGSVIFENIEYCLNDLCFDSNSKFMKHIQGIEFNSSDDSGDKVGAFTSSFIEFNEGTPLPTGEKVKVINLYDFSNYDMFRQMVMKLNGLIIKGEYKNVYDEKFEVITSLDEDFKGLNMNPLNCS